MAYSYAEQRPFVFTEDGQKTLLNVLDKARECLKASGAVSAGVLLSAATGSGDSWARMACIERLVELGYLRLVPCNEHRAWQDNVYVAGGKLS